MKRIKRIISTYNFYRNRIGKGRINALLTSLYLDGGGFFSFIEWWKRSKQERTP